MQTVYIVAIAVAAGGILGLCWIFRRRLTALTVTFQNATLKIKAKPDDRTANPQILPGKGAVFEDAKISGAKVSVRNSRLIVRRSLMKKGSDIEISEPSSPSGSPDE